MRLLILIHSLASGGAERVCANLATAWAQRGVEVTVVTFASSGRDFYPLPASVKRIALDMAGESRHFMAAINANSRRVLAIRRVLREIKPDRVLAMMNTANVLAVLANLGLSSRVLVSEHIHPPMMPVRFIWERLRYWTYPMAAGVVALTEESGRWLQEHYPGSNVSVIPNPVKWPLARLEPAIAPETHIARDSRLLLAVGRLDKQKGFDLLLNAFARISANHPRWRLAIVGDGPERERLETNVAELGLLDRVIMPGRAGNIADWYERADLFVLSSRFEGFPNALVEAMASGVAAVSFDCDTGPRDIIRDGVDGVLVSPEGGTEALAYALSRLMGEDALRDRLSARATEVRERFSIAQVMSLWEAAFAGQRCSLIHT